MSVWVFDEIKAGVLLGEKLQDLLACLMVLDVSVSAICLASKMRKGLPEMPLLT